MKAPWGDTLLYGFFAAADFAAAALLVDERWAVIVSASLGGLMLGLILAQWSRWSAYRAFADEPNATGQGEMK